jgi:hypothetical protein
MAVHPWVQEFWYAALSSFAQAAESQREHDQKLAKEYEQPGIIKDPGGPRRTQEDSGGPRTTAIGEAEESDMDDLPEPLQELTSPHIQISVHAIHHVLTNPPENMSEAEQQARSELQTAWDAHIKDKEQHQVEGAIHVWRRRKPQKQGRSRSNPAAYSKLIFSMIEELEAPLVKYLVTTKAVQKQGKPPRSYLEREASTLLGKVLKKET